MKKKYMYLTLVLLIVLTMFVIIKPNKKQEVNVINEAKEIKSFAIYKQDASGNYVISSDTSFPTKGYLLNLEKTKCFDSNNNGISNDIVSQSLDGKITLQATQASYCDLYFTKDDDAPVVTTFSITGTKENNETLNSGYTHKTNVTYNIGWTASDVVSYCISTSQSLCNGSWVNVSGTSVSPTEPVLDSTEGKKTRYAFIKDRANNISVGKEASITLDLNNPTVSNVTYVSKDTSSITVNVTGSDTPNGSGIVKYECKATSQSTWFPQDSSGNCKVTDLSDNTSYTIEGRVTDASGRVSTNSVSTTQSTEAAYSCSAGEEMIQDSQKGSSSGGYICKTSASSKGWNNMTTYWTCDGIDGSRYDSESEAKSACENVLQGTCSSNGKIGYVFLPDSEVGCGGESRSEAVKNCENLGYSTRCLFGSEDICGIDQGPYLRDVISQGDEEWCRSSCEIGIFLKRGEMFECSLTGDTFPGNPSCLSACRSNGNVFAKTENNFYCPPGWSIYSGSDSSLQCYRAATKG